MSRLAALVAAFAVSLATAPLLAGSSPTSQVRVSIEFRQSGSDDHDALQGSGVIISRGDGVRGGTTLRGGSRTSHVTRTSGIFTIVQDGGDSLLRVATRVPYRDVEFYRDYATGAGYVAGGVVFQSVGTSLRVHADVLPDRRIRLHLVPRVSYFSADGSGAIDFTDAATDLVVDEGKPVDIGGSTTRSQEVVRRLFGYDSRSAESETSIMLRATFQP